MVAKPPTYDNINNVKNHVPEKGVSGSGRPFPYSNDNTAPPPAKQVLWYSQGLIVTMWYSQWSILVMTAARHCQLQRVVAVREIMDHLLQQVYLSQVLVVFLPSRPLRPHHLLLVVHMGPLQASCKRQNAVIQ